MVKIVNEGGKKEENNLYETKRRQETESLET